jgi:hypothetical protein
MRRLVALATSIAVLGGCADRGLASGPSSTPTTATWAAVTVAAVGAGVVLAALIVLPVMQPGGSVIGAWVLALQASGVAVAGAIIVGAAVRSEQLLDQPDTEQAASLLRLTALDGRDTGFFTLIVLVTLVIGGLIIAALVLAARFAADDDPLERSLAAGLLGIEVVWAVACWVLVALGFRHAGFVLPALSLPILVVAAWAAWPRDPVADP